MRPSHGRALVRLLLLAVALAPPGVAWAQTGAQAGASESVGGEPPLGARLDELLEMGRRLNPGVAAAALEADAAHARIGAAGRFPDPVFTTEIEDIRASGSTAAPESVGRVKYTLAQTIPLWGKRGLERDVAQAEAGAADQQRRSAEQELAWRIKTVFAQGYAAAATVRITRELLATLDSIARVAQSRYAQGQGNQQDAISAEAEKGRLQLDLERAEAQRLAAAARLNALLDRPAGALLAPPQSLPPVPGADAMPLEAVLAQAEVANPQLAQARAEITASERSAELVQRSWYPDVTLGVTVYDEDGDNDRQFGGYEAMVSLDVPLQWGLRRARERDAHAKLAASRARREDAAASLRGDIAEAWWALEAARRSEGVLRRINIPQSAVMLRSAQAGYELGSADLPGVLLAEQGVRRTELDFIGVQVEQQMRLADLERLVGGDL